MEKRNDAYRKFIKSSGNFLLTLGILILIFVGVKSLTFDPISDLSVRGISLKHPFAWSLFLAVILVIVGIVTALVFRKRIHKRNPNQTSIM